MSTGTVRGMLEQDAALAFVNTRLERPQGTVELLPDVPGLERWAERGVGWRVTGAPGAADLELVLRVRAAMRRLVVARIGGAGPDAADLRLVGEAAELAPRHERITPDWALRTWVGEAEDGAGPVGELLAWLAGGAARLLTQGSEELAECGAHDCVVLFRRSDPRQRWHSDRCGNRMRARRSYARRVHGG